MWSVINEGCGWKKMGMWLGDDGVWLGMIGVVGDDGGVVGG